MINEGLKNKFADIITLNQYEKYQVINFEKFLLRIFPDKNIFVDVIAITDIRTKLIAAYGNEKICFTDYGTLREIKFEELHYYQSDVGVNGPQHSSEDEPVFILRIDDMYILWNGYHRAFVKILAQKTYIQAYVLSIK